MIFYLVLYRFIKNWGQKWGQKIQYLSWFLPILKRKKPRVQSPQPLKCYLYIIHFLLFCIGKHMGIQVHRHGQAGMPQDCFQHLGASFLLYIACGESIPEFMGISRSLVRLSGVPTVCFPPSVRLWVDEMCITLLI